MSDVGELFFSKDHEWVRIEGSSARVGITAFAQDALGDVVFVQLPELGASVVVGQSLCEIESTKSVSDIYAPLQGTVSAVNTSLEAEPSLVNSDPLGKGWIYELSISPDAETSHLLDEVAYRRLVEG